MSSLTCALRELLRARESREQEIRGESFRLEVYNEPRRRCELSIGPFRVATVWRDEVQFSLPKPMNHYFRVHVNGTRINCTLEWRRDCSGVVVRVASEGFNRLVKVGLTRQTRVECYVGTRLLTSVTQKIDAPAITKELDSRETATVLVAGERQTGVEASYRYRKRDGGAILLCGVTVHLPLEFVAGVVGTLRVACLQRHNGATPLSNREMTDFSDVSADLYTPADWNLYRDAINALVEICGIDTINDTEAGWSSTTPRVNVSITSLRVSIQTFNDVTIPYYRVTEGTAVVEEASKEVNRIVWSYRIREDPEFSSLMPFVCDETFATRDGAVWGVEAEAQGNSVATTSCSLYDIVLGPCIKRNRLR